MGQPDGRQRLPPVDAILNHDLLADALRVRGRIAVRRAVRSVTDELRRRLKAGTPVAVEPESVAERALELLRRDRRWLRPVINATGILLHTGLGRAPLAREAIEAVAEIAGGYCNLELDLGDGARGRRTSGVAGLLRELTGAEAATVVNNNAGATVLALRALAAGKEVIVSRGQLVEIGGSFRLPEIFEVSGASLREVGTTNKTRITDYRRAIGPETAAILRVHPSNFRIVGFTESPPLSELVQLAHAHGLWAIDDIGSGALGPGRPPGVVDEPTAAEGLAAGADLVLFSGDKLLGGPQCGIMLGSREAIGRIEVDPLMRALRVDKLTLAALEATLRLAEDCRACRRSDPPLGDDRGPARRAVGPGRGDGGSPPVGDGTGRARGAVRGVHRSRQRPDPDDPVRRRRGLPAVPGPGPRGFRGGLGRGAPAGRSAGRRPGPGRSRPARPADRGPRSGATNARRHPEGLSG